MPHSMYLSDQLRWSTARILAAGVLLLSCVLTSPSDAQSVVPAQPAMALSPEAAAALERLLAAWETRNASVTTWSCGFYKWEYNAWSPADTAGERLAFSESTGEIKYAAPDKGLFRVKESKQWNGENKRYETRVGEAGEHWVCNGTSIYEFRHSERQLRETKLPPEMQGKAISDGPLPFVFGAKAETLKKRYRMRVITPPGVADQIWLEAQPRLQADGANFSKVELILQARDLMPFAMQIYKPGGQDRDVYQFDPRTNLIDKGLDMIRDFSRPMTPLGYTFILEDMSAPPAPTASQQPTGPPPLPRAG
ncbi:MAG: TIGR03009 domain-containing protein [Planctomycetia bacterium]|nr:TIGR03009 domain-containing protein [Planctomycetia bacterium]